MKTILLGTALMIGSVAYAQADPRDAGQPMGSGATMQPGTTMGERDTHGANMPAAPTADTSTSTSTTTTDTTAGSTMTTQGDMGAAGTTTGTTDMSTGTTGSGTTTVVQQGGNMAPPPEPRADYPRCSRTVTDNCVQDERRARDTKRTRR